MENQYTKQELTRKINIILAQTGMDPSKEVIDKVIPEEALEKYDPKDVLSVACENGFIVYKCYMDNENFRANGKWIRDNKSSNLQRYKNISDGLCPSCAESTLAKIDSGETGFSI